MSSIQQLNFGRLKHTYTDQLQYQLKYKTHLMEFLKKQNKTKMDEKRQTKFFDLNHLDSFFGVKPRDLEEDHEKGNGNILLGGKIAVDEDNDNIYIKKPTTEEELRHLNEMRKSVPFFNDLAHVENKIVSRDNFAAMFESIRIKVRRFHDMDSAIVLNTLTEYFLNKTYDRHGLLGDTSAAETSHESFQRYYILRNFAKIECAKDLVPSFIQHDREFSDIALINAMPAWYDDYYDNLKIPGKNSIVWTQKQTNISIALFGMLVFTLGFLYHYVIYKKAFSRDLIGEIMENMENANEIRNRRRRRDKDDEEYNESSTEEDIDRPVFVIPRKEVKHYNATLV